ncbi:MAG: hypothetical protein HY556_05725 [Euryarchaeota archaeon]|nr:hypothetical protein [Euryarchaeota archaeon]
MQEEILSVRYPAGELPARGFRCTICGEEVFLLADVGMQDDLAHRLGLFGVEDRRRRKLQRTGNSITVSLDPAILREVMPGAKPGDIVIVGRQGDKIVITAE